MMRNFVLLLYTIINVFLYVLNFELFNTQVSIDLGFASITTMPILLMIAIGFVFVCLFYWLETSNETKSNHSIKHLNDQIKLNEKDMEIMSLKHLNQDNIITPIVNENENTDVV